MFTMTIFPTVVLAKEPRFFSLPSYWVGLNGVLNATGSTPLRSRASKKGLAGCSLRAPRKKNYFSLAPPASGAIQRVGAHFTAMGTRSEHAAQSPPSRWAPWGRSPQKKETP
ncbi:MAG: hypothetical protein DME22_24550 [Verrucomicrobia bacterium]|nr:MAG: hypothetical protein DME22_24550 [Verrucomicrobiota bacterium]PYJ96414.1 MAG: hypothetical protein DME23_20845 [Verrucomicrobiota bacterium]